MCEPPMLTTPTERLARVAGLLRERCRLDVAPGVAETYVVFHLTHRSFMSYAPDLQRATCDT